MNGVALGRREILAATGAALATAGVLAPGAAIAQVPGANAPRGGSAAGTGGTGGRSASSASLPPGLPGRDYSPVIVPNGAKLPWKIVGGVKVFHMVAEEVEHELAPGLKVLCWGYNGAVHGPVLEWMEGERVRVYVTNRLPAATTVHWHGILLPNGMDGVGGLTQRAIQPGETFKYEFTVRQHGTG
ncbi:MAG: multicopper oxidase domain-containing protein, partial [Myxococcales bacterium]|nr:multicopper oxidase domain-containing protein [Myxococcales bacterium]